MRYLLLSLISMLSFEIQSIEQKDHLVCDVKEFVPYSIEVPRTEGYLQSNHESTRSSQTP